MAEVNTGKGWDTEFYVFITNTSSSQWLTLYLVLVMDTHYLQNENEEEKQVNISSRHSQSLENTF